MGAARPPCFEAVEPRCVIHHPCRALERYSLVGLLNKASCALGWRPAAMRSCTRSLRGRGSTKCGCAEGARVEVRPGVLHALPPRVSAPRQRQQEGR